MRVEKRRVKNFFLSLIIWVILFGFSSNSLAVELFGNVAPLNIQGRLLTGADNFPEDTISLLDVFRNPIGDGPTLLNNNKALQIVGTYRQTGAIWSQRQIDLLEDFSFTGYIYLGDGTNGSSTSNSTVADGVTMVFQNDSRMATDPDSVLGPGGAALGVYSVNAASNNKYIKNAIALEFDPYRNGNIDTGVSTLYGGHVAVMIPQARNDLAAGRTHYGVITSSTPTNNGANRLSNNTWRELTIEWSAKTKTLSYSFENFGSSYYTVSNLETTFGGTKVYWGFTGSTGSLGMDARIALTEIPGSADQELQAQNITKKSDISKSVVGEKDDIIQFSNVITPDLDAILTGKSASIEFTLPDGLSYQEDSIYINGKQINNDLIVVEGNTVRIINQDMTKQEDYHLIFDTKITSDINNQLLKTSVGVYSTRGSIWSMSNSAQVTIQKFGKVTFNYLDMSGNSILDSKIIKGVIGTTYDKESYKMDIDGYTFEYIEDKNDNQFKEDPIEISFYYKALEIKRTVEINYVDQKGNALHAPVALEGLVGTIINLLDYTDHKEAIDDVLKKNYLLNDEDRPSDEAAYTIKIENNQITYTFTGILTPTFDVPALLDFGTQTFKSNQVERFVATLDGEKGESAKEMTGKISLNDTRSDTSGWNLQVRQEGFFSSVANMPLLQTALIIDVGTIEKFEEYSNRTMTLEENENNIIVQAKNGQGLGETEIPLNKFELTVGKNSMKRVSEYRATIVWTLSNTP